MEGRIEQELVLCIEMMLWEQMIVPCACGVVYIDDEEEDGMT